MKNKKLWAFLTVATTVGVLYGTMGRGSADEVSYRFVAGERGTVETVVASSASEPMTREKQRQKSVQLTDAKLHSPESRV